MSRKIPLYLLLSLQFAIQVIGIVGIVGYLSYRSGREAVNNLVEHLMDDTGDRIEQELDNYLQQAHQINQLNISALKSGVINLDNLDQLHRYLILQHKQLPNITSLLLGTEKGDFRTIHRITQEQITRRISMIKPTELPLEAGISEITPSGNNFKLYTVDKNGNIDRYLDTLHNFDVRKRPWYLDAVKSNEQGWSKPFQIGNTNILTINAYAPFSNSSQTIEGVFSVHLSLNQLSQFLQKLSVSQHGEIFILERNGLLIADSYHDTPFHYQIEEIPQPSRQEDFKIKFERISAFDDKNGILSPLAEKLKANKVNLDHIQAKQQFEIKFDNENYYSAVIPYQDSYGLDWLIVIAIPESQFLDTIKNNADRTLILSIIALILAIISSIITSRRITRSLSGLSHVADDFNPKSEPPLLPLSYIQEISTLSDSFRQMTINLNEAEKFKHDYTRKLEQEVKEKTEILSEQIFGTLNERQLKAIATIESSASHLLDLINDILDIAKIEAGETILERNPTDVKNLCQSVLTFVQQQAYKKNIQLFTDFPPELPYLLIDQRRIRQALINLLNNAVKFTPEGGKITLQVSIYEERRSQLVVGASRSLKNQELGKDKDISPLNPPLIRQEENSVMKTFIRFAVIDTGIGISSENINKLFKPFIQIDSALNRKYTGTGLGLSLVKQIIELHGGNVGVSSELGKGSCFYFDLPSNSFCNLPQSSIKDQNNLPTTDITITPSVILLVDDEESNIITISYYLEAKGYELLIAQNGLQALEITKSQHPDLIIMDIQMSEMDGLDAIELIRQDEDEGVKDIPIIASTALTMDGDKKRCLDVGANDYISKPMKLKELVQKIETLLQ